MEFVDGMNDLLKNLNWSESNNWSSNGPSIHWCNDYDITPFIKLYGNCKYMDFPSNGSSGMVSSTISPELWFEGILPHLISSVKAVSTSRNFFLFSIVGDKFTSTSKECESVRFSTDQEMIDFLTEKGSSDGDLVLYCIRKFIDLVDIKTYWVVNYSMITSPKITRERKIKSIIK